ncbi:MAG TPA: hypothetical protein VGB02_02415 [Pyrinomonadaceae bacterium]|jgi:hypothetical protein
MLDELVNRVAERTGLSQEQARTAAETVIGFLKERLPASVGGALDGAVQGGENSSSGMMDQAQGMLGNLGGMFGGNKE